jgi:chitin synthase
MHAVYRGETRKVAGQGKDEGHTDKDGEFDSSEIVMKRWADFERDRRYKLGAHSRDSTYNVIHRTTSPERSSNRYSTVSSVDTFLSNGGSAFVGDGLLRKGSPGISTSHSTEGSYAGPRYPQQLELPAPLGGQASGMSAASSLTSVHRYTPSSTPELPSSPFEESMRYPSDPSLPIVPRQTLGTHDYTYPRYAEGYDSDEVEREAILSDGGSSKPHSPRPDVPYSRPARERPSSRQDLDSLVSPLTSTLDHTVTSTPSSPEISTNPFSTYATNARKLRGVSLVDSGPVPGTEGVRVAQRSRRTSQGPSSGQSPTHRNRNSIQSPSSLTDTFAPPLPMTGGLPPGAAPPQSRQG